jgi:glycosyltransferase involved in cell wall biosynthesis
MKELLIRHGVAPPDKCVTILSGMEVEPFLTCGVSRDEARKELGYSPEHIVVGKIARLFRLKGHDDLIAAANQAVRINPQLRFLCVGGGVLEKRLKKQVSKLGLTPYFHFAGLVPPEKLPRFLSAMDIVVHTSLREGLARVLPQALLAGKPVISYDIDGAREVVLPEKTGVLLPPRDVEGLVGAILRLAENPQLRFQWGEAGRRWCAERFSHEKMSREIHALYCRLLSEKGLEKPRLF